MRVAILGGNGLRQSVGAVARAFQRAGHQVVHIPTLPGLDPEPPVEAFDLLFTFKIGHENIPRGYVRMFRAECKLFWSFDDPLWVDRTSDLWLPSEHDMVLTSCLESTAAYEGKCSAKAYFMPPAMDTEYYRNWREGGVTGYPISFICTNLYRATDFPDNVLSRDWMVKMLYADHGKDFALWGYGPTITSKAAWRGALDWETTLPRVMERSLININNHVIYKRHLYMNERFFQIVSTGRAQFVDRVNGFEDLFGSKVFVYYSSLNELQDKIKFYKEKPALLTEIGQAGLDALKGWTYDAFVKTIIDGLGTGKLEWPTFLRSQRG